MNDAVGFLILLGCIIAAAVVFLSIIPKYLERSEKKNNQKGP